MAYPTDNQVAMNGDDHNHKTRPACPQTTSQAESQPVPTPKRPNTTTTTIERDEDTDASVANSTLRASFHEGGQRYTQAAMLHSDASAASSLATSMESTLSTSLAKAKRASFTELERQDDSSHPRFREHSQQSNSPLTSFPPPPPPLSSSPDSIFEPPPDRTFPPPGSTPSITSIDSAFDNNIPPPPRLSITEPSSHRHAESDSESRRGGTSSGVDGSDSQSPQAIRRVRASGGRRGRRRRPGLSRNEQSDSQGLDTSKSLSSSFHALHSPQQLDSPRKNPKRRVRFPSSEESLGSRSSTYSRSRRKGRSNGSESSFVEETVNYRNTKMFPPATPSNPSRERSKRSSAVNHIADWVSRYEHSRASPEEDELSDLFLTSDQQEAEPVTRETQIERLWQKLKSKRANVHEIKSDMAKKRKDMRKLRRKRDEADDMFIKLFRPALVGTTAGQVSHAHLTQRFSKLQEIRSEYKYQEEVYEGMEVTLDEEEEELNGVEIRFFSLLASDRTAGHSGTQGSFEDEQVEATRPKVPEDLMGIAHEGPAEDLHPLYEELTATIGDLENAKEEYHDLVFLKEQHELELEATKARNKDSLNDVGEIPDEAKAFLDEYASEEEKMRTSMAKLETRVQELRKLCDHKGVMRKHMSIRTEYLFNPKIEYDDLELDDVEAIRSREPRPTKRFNDLVSEPYRVVLDDEALSARLAAKNMPSDDPKREILLHSATKERAIDELIRKPGKGNEANFVSRWLLHQLRLSSFLALFLELTFKTEALLRIRDPQRWQHDVLYYWWLDGASRREHRYGPSSGLRENLSGASSRARTSQPSRRASDTMRFHKDPIRNIRAGSSDIQTVT